MSRGGARSIRRGVVIDERRIRGRVAVRDGWSEDDKLADLRVRTIFAAIEFEFEPGTGIGPPVEQQSALGP